MDSNQLDKSYKPHDVEKKWYDFWEKEQLFAASEESAQESYSIVIPPPNVTGVLHMGHALNVTLQDILCRFMRIRNNNVLWMPGTDHAGIATQNVVERKLASEGLDRHQLGREKFIEAVWEWRSQYGSAIINQLKRLGASCDWKRERFTMDKGLSVAVRKVFVQLYDEGLIYRGNYITNWCPRCRTALAELEVEHDDHNGHLYYILYPFEKGSGGILIATTRPETMFGDTAVAVNPDDKRYQNLESDRVILPLIDKLIPVIRDKYVDMSFGTGGLKVTPAHDPNDFEIGKRHNLPIVRVIGDDGAMTPEAGRFNGLDRFKCRDAVIKELKKKGLLKKIEPYNHSVGHCYRCKTVVEPNLSLQWFVSTKPLAKKAIEAVEKGDTRIIPETWTKTYFEWMNNIRDWCISRQIWWGHQIPAWTCEDCGEIVVAVDTPESCPACKSTRLVQETDVLDTWFSSALWPFSTMGWPENTPLLKKFYPTAVLITGFDILFFWIARMMMMGIHFMGEVPFKDVYVHALVRDVEGKKMSKSKGNVIDPLSVIDKYGTDAFRFTLAAFAAQGRDIKMSEDRVEGYRHFINKLWNASRFAFMHITEENSKHDAKSLYSSNLTLPDRWILSRLIYAAENSTEAINSYRFNEAAGILYKFVWHEFCDWYLEAIKPSLYGKQEESSSQATMNVLWTVLRDTLILLHPFIPFVTEEIWNKLPGTQGSIMRAKFPLNRPDNDIYLRDNDAESEMSLITEIITGIRNVRGEMNIAPSLLLDVIVQSQDVKTRKALNLYKNMIINLAGLKTLVIELECERPKAAGTAVIKTATLYVLLEGVIDFDKEINRLEKENTKLTNELVAVSRKLNNESFLNKAPENVVQKVKEKQRIIVEKQQKIELTIEKIKEFA